MTEAPKEGDHKFVVRETAGSPRPYDVVRYTWQPGRRQDGEWLSPGWRDPWAVGPTYATRQEAQQAAERLRRKEAERAAVQSTPAPTPPAAKVTDHADVVDTLSWCIGYLDALWTTSGDDAIPAVVAHLRDARDKLRTPKEAT